jgi:hypothetical protein
MLRPTWMLGLVLLAMGDRPCVSKDLVSSPDSFEPSPAFQDVGARWQQILRAQDSVYDEPLATDRPDFTEASSVVGRGVLQLETGYTYFHDDEDGTETQTHSLPETLFRYGISDTVELRLVWNYFWEQTDDAASRTRRDGADDLVLGAKFALTSQDGLRPESALIVDMSTPTGGAAFTNHHCELGTNYLWGYDLENDKSIAGSFGYGTLTDSPGANSDFDRYNVFHASVTHGFSLVESLNMYIEYFGLYYDGLSGGRPENYVDSGITYLPNNNLQFDIRLGIGLNDAAVDYFAGPGVSARF